MTDKKKNIIIAILIVLLLLSCVLISYLITKQNNSLEEIAGTIVEKDKEYILIKVGDESYIITNIENNYQVGDEVKFTYKSKDLNTKNIPKTIKAEKSELMNGNKESENPSVEEKPTTTSKPTTNAKTTKNTTQAPVKNADEEVLEYFTKLETDFKSSSIKDSLKSGFITVVDFIFYGGTINGHTFKDLSDSAKLKVLNMALYFDEKIDTYFPGYKETISTNTNKIYTKVKNEVIEAYLNTAIKVCETNEELCTTAKNGFQEIKKNFKLTWTLIKDIATDGKNSLQKWYEIFRGSNS